MLLFAIAFPVVVLVFLASCFMYQQSQTQFRQQIVAWKAEGDKLREAGGLRAAYDRYKVIIAEAGGSSDAEIQRVVREAKIHRDKLEPGVKVQLEQEDAERRRQEQERQRLEELEIQRQAEANARLEAKQRRLQREAELALINASVVGGAWITKGGGQSDILRGLSIYVLRSEVARRRLDAAVIVMQQQPDFDKFGADAKDLPTRPPDDRVDLERVFKGVRHRNDSNLSSSSAKMIRIKKDVVWPQIALAALVTAVKTDIDGKYKIPKIKGGNYLVYAVSETSFSTIEWLVPLEIDRPEEVNLDLYNENAETILNKNNG
jgi:hypothetical protein